MSAVPDHERGHTWPRDAVVVGAVIVALVVGVPAALSLAVPHIRERGGRGVRGIVRDLLSALG